MYTALYLAYLLPSVPPSVSTILVLFMVIFLVSAFLVWRRSRVGFILGIIMSVIFLLQFGSEIGQFFANPSETSTFVPVATIIPALIATIVYSVVGAKMVWTKGVAATRPRRTIPYSSTLALLTVGFIVGSLVVGAFAGGTEARLLANSGKSADIIIVSGAGTQGNPAGYFLPDNYIVKVGQTVVWENGDGNTHTVTSSSVPSGASPFDSGNIAPGGQFSWTFTQPGTYQYYCTLHPWMKGIVIVVSG